MKSYNLGRIGILMGVLLVQTSVACGAAEPLKRISEVAPIAGSTPALVKADERVRQAKVELETARKQLVAAKALLKAADADFKAAKADKEALALQTKAEGLADASGLKRLAVRVDKVPTAAQSEPVGADTTSSLSPGQTRIQQLDFNAEPVQGGPALLH
ncbi:MAG: hypothetical protein HY711_01130 [Candidatus Melainabacteria bacterium]|nr:hypothetical protein [Candidatus Melainabacteria bacterium]